MLRPQFVLFPFLCFLWLFLTMCACVAKKKTSTKPLSVVGKIMKQKLSKKDKKLSREQRAKQVAALLRKMPFMNAMGLGDMEETEKEKEKEQKERESKKGKGKAKAKDGKPKAKGKKTKKKGLLGSFLSEFGLGDEKDTDSTSTTDSSNGSGSGAKTPEAELAEMKKKHAQELSVFTRGSKIYNRVKARQLEDQENLARTCADSKRAPDSVWMGFRKLGLFGWFCCV